MTNYLSHIREVPEREEYDTPASKTQPQPGFLEIYEKKIERRRLETLITAGPGDEVDKKQKHPDLAMQKLFLSRLLSLGGIAPIIPADDPNASAVLLHALQAMRYGSRRLFTQDSDLFSIPQFPIVHFTDIY